MDLWSLKLHLAIWTLLSRPGVFSLEVSVRHSELKPCEGNDRVCVTDSQDCQHPPPSSLRKTLNMSCYYQETSDQHMSVTCSWSQVSESKASLVFTSDYKIFSCRGIFNPAATLEVTARIKNYLTGREVWSQPHRMFLFDKVKPSQPALALIASTADSLVASWKSSVHGSCRLRYRPNDAHTWTEVSDLVPAYEGQTLNYTITNLLPFMAYTAAVACTTQSGIWSDWSSDTTIQTLDRAPSQPPEMCYRVEKTGTDVSLLLHLIWMAPDPGGAKCRVLGYRVSINPHEPVQNVTETTLLLVVKEGNYSITVEAFNTAGFGPAARLQIDTQTQISLPSVRNLWISSDFPEDEELLVQWTLPGAPSSVPPGSHAAVQWHSEKNLSTSRWRRVDGFTSSAVITDVDPDESYLVSVFPVYGQQCGPPQSLAASLQHGALMEVVSLTVISVTKTTVTVMWAWQRKSAPIRVDRYRLMLRRDTDTRILSLWPDQQHQHTFSNLTPSTEYSLLLLADNISRSIILVATHFDEVPVVVTATPLLLLVVSVMIISILSRTVYKSYFFPPVSSPRRSTAGQWLLNPNLRKCVQMNLLDITDFQVTDVLGQNHRILVGPNDHLSSEVLHKDKSLQSISNLFVQMSTIKLDIANVSGTKPIRGQESDIRPITEQQLCSLPSVFTSDTILLHRHEECSWSPESEEDIYLTSHHQDQSDVQFPELLTDLLRRPETESGPLECSNMIHEVKYLTNGCFRAEPTAGDEISPVLT